jgi:hypothetical protein
MGFLFRREFTGRSPVLFNVHAAFMNPAIPGFCAAWKNILVPAMPFDYLLRISGEI